MAAWAEKGIVGRGIVLDFHSWQLANNIPDESFQTGSFTLDQLEAVAKAQETEIKFGDILIIRSGHTNDFNKLPKHKADTYASMVPPKLTGAEQSEGILQWFWNKFSAVAGDQPSFEYWREWN